MLNPNYANLTQQYQQAYLIYCYKIMQYLQALAWISEQETPSKQPNTATYSEKRTSGFNFFSNNQHQQKSNFKSLKYLENYNVKNKSASILLVYTHDIAGRTETIKDRNGNSSVFVYDNAGSVIAETNGEGETTYHEYNNYRLETKRIDSQGNETSWTYDDFGNQLTETDDLGNTTTSTYNHKGEILTQTDSAGNVVLTNEYIPDYNPELFYLSQDGYGQLKKVTDALGNTTEFHWISGTTSLSPSGRSVTANTGFTDAKGNRYDVSPISSGGITAGLNGSTTDLNGLKTESTYDDEARPLTQSQIITDANGVEIARYTTTFEYNENGDVIKTTDTLGNFTQTQYNSLNKVSATIDADGNRTTYEFDNRGNPSKTTYPDGTFDTITYDLEGNTIGTTDRVGQTTSTTYDAANRVIKVTASNGSFTTNDYDGAGRLTAVTDVNGNSTSYTYDELGRRTTTTDALGHQTSFVYNNLGRRTQSTDALGRMNNFEYNALGNLTKTIFANSTFTSTTYDELSRKVSQTDLAGRTTQYEYSNAGNLTAVIDSINQRTEYEYDQRGNKTTQTDANNNVTSWAYDALARVSTRTLPEGQSESYSYNSLGNMASKTDFNGDTTSYAYNNLNQLVTKTYADSTSVTNTYTTLGQIKTITEVNGTTSYQYDIDNRLSRIDYPDGNFTAYQYDLGGNRTQVQTASQTVAYTFDALNRSQTVTEINGITTYAYDNVGNRASQTNTNGTTATYQYDNLNRLIDLTHTDANNAIIASYAYTLGANGNRLSIQETTGRIVDYTYDDLYRLTSETITDAINGDHYNEFAYDSVGNRLQQFKDGITTTYVYNNNDQIESETENAVITSYIYDNNGNTLTKSVDAALDTSYSYNKDNRMIQAVTPSSTITNTYDAGGIRQSQTVDGITTNYLVDQNRSYAQVLEEQDVNNIVETTYVYGDDLISQTNAEGTHNFGYDGLGSTRILTDIAGTVQNAYGYEAFGEVDYQLGTIENKYLFTGEQYDNNVGFYYLRARFYNPGNGRFLNMDTFAGMAFEPKSLHKYLYTHADPINNIDPSGNVTLQGLLVGLTGLGIVVNVATYAVNIATGNVAGLALNIAEDAIAMLIPGGVLAKHAKKLAGLLTVTRGKGFQWGIAHSSKALGVNLKLIKAPKSCANCRAHHMIPGGEKFPSAQNARKILEKYDIDINSFMNGVWLDATAHTGRHAEAYSKQVFKLLEQADKGGKQAVYARLSLMQKEMQGGLWDDLL